jgi:two-component system phosphate regulon sensor histidine kinase PhoR
MALFLGWNQGAKRAALVDRLDRLASGSVPDRGEHHAALPSDVRRRLETLRERLLDQAEGLQQQRRMLTSVIEALPDPILVVDRRLTIRDANAAAVQRFDLPRAGLPLARGLRDAGVLAAVRAALQSHAASGVTFSPMMNRLKQFSARIEPVRLEGGAVGVLIAAREQTEQVMIERMRSDFVANASHELRNPLATIQGTIETLRGPARNDPQGQSMLLGLMEGEAARMTRLVDDLLLLSRTELAASQPPTQRCDMRVVVEQAIERSYALAAPTCVRIETSLPPTLPPVVGDPDQLHQLLVNLVDNAVKYGGDGKTVMVKVLSMDAAPAEAGPVAKQPCVMIAVRDEGPGIPKEHIPRLTERFYRVDTARSRRLRGTGLGLAIVKHILRRHQGYLMIQSEIGRGSTFSVYLPALQVDAGCHDAVTKAS